MKKQLLLGTALFLSLSVFSQQHRVQNASSVLAYKAGTIADKYAVINETAPKNHVAAAGPVQQTKSTAKKAAALGVWDAISKSENIFGVLLSSSKPLQYDENLNAVSFIQRKSPYYQPSPAPTPAAASGAIVAMVSTNWGGNWDSTLVWNRDDYLARYPQGGIYNPPGNTNISNAYAVAMGPGTTPPPQSWVGNFYASKKLNAFTNVADAAPMAQQFILSSPADSVLGKVDFARNDFAIPDDGNVRAAGLIYDAVNPSFSGFQGMRVLKGTFNVGGYFTWTSDSLTLANSGVQYDNNTSTYDAIGGLVNTAWSESGQYGYAWFIGVRSGATDRNKGYQPIVWKTSNYGTSWSLMPGINFNDTTTFKPVLDHLINVRYPEVDTVLAIPFFNFREDIGGIVDKNNNLHIVSTVWSTSRSHQDSVGYTYQFNNADGETYSFAHVPGFRPYIYDFSSKANGSWEVVMVDSMSTEAPGQTATAAGYNSNPWAVYDNSKQGSDARIQLSRTPDGEYVVYTWAESDTLVTSSGFKWNNIPDIHARVRHVDSANVHQMEYNLSNDPLNPDLNVAGRAWMHNTSPKCALTATAANGFTIALPVKVSNSTPLTADNPNTHYFSSAVMSFTLAEIIDTTGISESNLGSLKASKLFPNPASEQATLQISMKDQSDIQIDLMNMIGQVITTRTVKTEIGQNTVNIDLDGVPAGLYLVTVKAGEASTTKKLVVE